MAEQRIRRAGVVGLLVPKKSGNEEMLIVYSGRIEFGWLLCTFIPFARRVSRRHKKTIVYCEKGHEYLYRDFAAKTYSILDKSGARDRWLFRGKPVGIPKKVKRRHPGAQFLCPNRGRCMSTKREYFRYGDAGRLAEVPELIIHARAVKQHDWIDRRCGGSRNYPVKGYKTIADFFGSSIRYGCIGSKKGSHLVPGAVDLRGISMKDLCDIICASKVVVGTSSGPMHLAHLCGTPTVIFSDARKQKCIGGSNKIRYKKAWRAWPDVPVKVLEEPKWAPGVERVIKKVEKYL